MLKQFQVEKKNSSIKFFHLNLNDKFKGTFDIKVPSIQAFLSTHSFDTLCCLKSFLDSTIDLNDRIKSISGYSILRASSSNSDKNNIAGLEIDNVTIAMGCNQVINRPKRLINGTSSCTDLFFLPI